MPDWSYRTIFRPALFMMHSRIARDITLKAIGGLSKLPGGSAVIRTLGHMAVPPILQSKLGDISIQSPVGLSGNVDIHGNATKALSQFGFGFMEIGPVTVNKVTSELPIERDLHHETIIYPIDNENDGLDIIKDRLAHRHNPMLPVMVRIKHSPECSLEQALNEYRQIQHELSPYAAGFYMDILDDRWPLELILDKIHTYLVESHDMYASKPLFLYIPLDYPLHKLHQLQPTFPLWDGVVIGDMIYTDKGYEVGHNGKLLSMEIISQLRGMLHENQTIIVTGGIHEPQDALDLLHAGAQFVQLHSGLVYAGPGLAKRINDVLVYNRIHKEVKEPEASTSFWSGWGWMYLLGIAMIIGGGIAWLIAATTVVLSYDLKYLGMDRELLLQLNDRLLPFMSHDRITLAGTMISIGILYAQLARHGLRRGMHWSYTALFLSCLVGFSSFFLYLGYGYFDPLHALVAAALLPMFLLSMRTRVNEPNRLKPHTNNNRIWLRALWGQLMFIILGCALAVGGLTIAFVGVTDVFVVTDLEFLDTTNVVLEDVNDRLLPLIAHDRAGFGGALFSNALAIIVIALWGIHRGERWLWWTLLGGGLPGFIAVFSVHYKIMYTDFIHLLPAYSAFGIYVLGLILLYPYMVTSNQEHRPGYYA